MLYVLQPSHQDRALLGKSDKKKTPLLGSSLLPTPQHTHPRGLREAGPYFPRQPGLPPPWCPLLCSHSFPRNSPPLGSPPLLLWYPLLACPSPHSCLVNSSLWLQALGQRLLTHEISWAQAGSLPVPFTHCTLPPPEAEGSVLSHQQTCQGLSRCQALPGTPTHSSSKQPPSASHWPPQLCMKDLAIPLFSSLHVIPGSLDLSHASSSLFP